MANNIEIEDYASPFLNWAASAFPDYSRKALKSTGWWMQQEIKKGIRSKAPGGQQYKEMIPSGIRRAIESAGTGYKTDLDSANYKPLGKLVNAVGYEYRASSNSVVVGWLSESAVMRGSRIEKGFTSPVNDEVRRLFWFAGTPLRAGKTTITISARPTYAPMLRVLAPKVAEHMENKIIEYLRTPIVWGNPNAKRPNRKYRVFG